MIVSIHTRHYWRVKPRRPAPCAGQRRFNPHPPLLAGETSTATSCRIPPPCFNPHPPLLAGETQPQPQAKPRFSVSIHTRHYWRVKRLGPARLFRPSSFNPHPPLLAGETRRQHGAPVRNPCFNPHPPLLAGETHATRTAAVHAPVSIHTRHYWRVKPPRRLPAGTGRCFNPHPPLLAGETTCKSAGSAVRPSFNPHPPLLAGETCCRCRASSFHIVSIHTRHYWRVKPFLTLRIVNAVGVSIHTRHYWRVKPTWPAPGAVFHVFQSTPAITGG